MTMSNSRIIYAAAGAPIDEVDGNESGMCADLPEARRGFWDGTGRALAVRPRGGVRGATTTGDTAVTVEDLEAAVFWWEQE